MSALITGAAGSLAGLVARRMADAGVDGLVGADLRALPEGRGFPGEFHQLKRYNHRATAELFRRYRFDAVIHLGRSGAVSMPSGRRYTQNVLGTRHLLDLCLRYDVPRVVVLSTYHVYGAHQHNHVNIGEDEPLRSSQIFPELIDVVELDHAATMFTWRYPEVATAVLRPVNIIGPDLHNLMSRLLRRDRCPRLTGYDPMMQFIHQDDMAEALRLAAAGRKRGVFNVAGEGTVAWTHAIKRAGARPVSVPHFLLYPIVGSLRRVPGMFPSHLIDYFRYPTVIDDALFRRSFGYAPALSAVDTLRSLRT